MADLWSQTIQSVINKYKAAFAASFHEQNKVDSTDCLQSWVYGEYLSVAALTFKKKSTFHLKIYNLIFKKHVW